MPDCPTTRFFGKPVARFINVTIASKGIGNNNDQRIRGVFFYSVGNRGQDFGVGAEKIIAAHARFAGNSRRDNANVGAGNIFIVIGADDIAVKAFDRSGMR